jgi:hypothetical protein
MVKFKIGVSKAGKKSLPAYLLALSKAGCVNHPTYREINFF